MTRSCSIKGLNDLEVEQQVGVGNLETHSARAIATTIANAPGKHMSAKLI